jgi:hypothetical protein
MTTTLDKPTKTLLSGVTALDWSGTITTDGEQRQAALVLQSVKTNAKALKATKEALTKPANETLRNIRALFKPAEEKLGVMEVSIKSAMLAYVERREAEAQAEMDRIERDGRTKVATKMARLAQVDTPDTDLGTAQVKYGKNMAVIVDPTWVPVEYLYRHDVVDAIRKEIQKDIDAGVEVPSGVRMERKRIVAGFAGEL